MRRDAKKFKLKNSFRVGVPLISLTLSLRCDTIRKSIRNRESTLRRRPDPRPFPSPEKKGGRLLSKRPQVKGGNAQGGHGDNNVVAPQQYVCAPHKRQALFYAAMHYFGSNAQHIDFQYHCWTAIGSGRVLSLLSVIRAKRRVWFNAPIRVRTCRKRME